MTSTITPIAATMNASDLQIEIIPRVWTQYRGAAAQLMAEGLIPDGFKWPASDHRVTIQVGNFSHWIGRERPEGHKGPKSSWNTADFWFLRRELLSQERDGWMDARIYEKKQEIADIIYRRTGEWERLYAKACKAREDDRYMMFRNLLVGEPRRGRGRPRKTVTS
jgi:hypothetical protein